ncbi:MAG: gliding motility-associated ABC transporter ATP-binding subunit GldA [Bacteroidales bacterium]|jgi:ABC-2 type transport system ATP-binding protein|nr:gliding motility-associated ABC transporter ATP-binding subunit GldA [Bacteroidales bacterium]MDD3701321.1 gliding motility-associated ABC transporter ATP-binding subunit GldA [Bacteroidales bacterium]MDY0370552.1 gliding motility-associated ABC transporter ATP-binding subunit GldA [Bacteroidales bacterium]
MSVIVNKITKRYGEQKALDDVSLTIQSGEIVGLLGPNGAGKSTLMKILSCFIPPTEGTASVMGFDVQEHPQQVQRLVGYLPETNPLYTDMYIREYLSFVAGIYKLGKKASQRIEEMIELTGLEIELHKKIGMLSKGFRQRVGLAQAMLHDPEVLILDEPTSGLDPNQLVDIRNLIKELGKSKTVILSTHIMQEVEAVCDQAIIINKGRIVAYDTTLNLMSMAGGEVILVEFDRAVQPHQFKRLSNLRRYSHQHDNNWLLEPVKGKDIRADLNRWAADQQLHILSLQRKTLRLEETFFQLTKK